MDTEAFRKEAHEVVDWIADYFENIEELPVKSPAQPGSVKAQLPEKAPEQGESFDRIFSDFQDIIVPGMTHWQHPRFMAYFPANNSGPSILGEMLTAAMGAQCMSWQTSPAATELEERVMEWLRELIGLPEVFTGVIQDTASTATLCALLMAREHATGYQVNEEGFGSVPPMAVYCSTETHSSIEKDVKIAGYGRSALRKLPVDEAYAMNTEALEQAIREDIEQGIKPACVVAATGTTGSTAMDPLEEIGHICKKYDIWMHVDAAFAGTALLLPEKRDIARGVEQADTFVFNPHKWMFTNFDCSAFYVKDVDILLNTFEILPEYLKTREDRVVNNYRDWGIQLGRRFRALKLWFVLRSFGADGLRARLRHHLELAEELTKQIEGEADFELLAPVPLNTICFRYHPEGVNDEQQLERLNARLLDQLQETGFVYLTHTKLSGRYTVRIVIGQTNVERRHVQQVWDLIRQTARSLDLK